MRTFIYMVVLLALIACSRKLHTQTSVIELDSLHITPEGAAQLAKLGVTLTPIGNRQVLLTQPVATKTKIKNLGNVAVGKKGTLISGEGNSLDNSETKDKSKISPGGSLVVGDGNNVPPPAKRTSSYWFVWLIAAVVLVAAAIIFANKILR